MADAPAPPLGLYVHVPFCVSRCPYCDFVVYAGADARGARNRVGAFLGALHAELDLRADALDLRFGRPGRGRPHLRSLYLGGGTPSLLPAAAVEAIVAHVGERFGLEPDAEVTLEANPGPDERGEAVARARAGVTRLSLGAQRLDDAALRRLGRRHTSADVAEALDEARAAGIRSVSLDLLYDLPDDTAEEWAASLDAALELAPDHLSLYALTLDDPDPDASSPAGPGAATADHLPVRPGARRWRDRARGAQDEDRAAAAYESATARLAASGYRGYEISNWARPGHESRHNLLYWLRRPHEAVGPGAHAFDGVARRWNAARLDGYLDALAPATGRPRLPPGGEARLEPAAAAVETVVLGLRLDSGLPLAAAARPPLGPWLGWARAARLLEVRPGERVILTTRGRLLSNELFHRLV